jgi:hypothetical protein
MKERSNKQHLCVLSKVDEKMGGKKLGLGLALRIKHLPRFRVYFYREKQV